MARGSPSLVALLGLLAVAGYQNRDKLGEMLNGRPGTGGDRLGSGTTDTTSVPQTAGVDGGHGSIVDSFRQMAGGGGLMGGLSELFERFSSPGHQAKAQSWVRSGPNETIGADELAQVLDEDTIAELTQKTGLTRDELLSRLSQTLPDAVDQATPNGQFPPMAAQEPRLV